MLENQYSFHYYYFEGTKLIMRNFSIYAIRVPMINTINKVFQTTPTSGPSNNLRLFCMYCMMLSDKRHFLKSNGYFVVRSRNDFLL